MDVLRDDEGRWMPVRRCRRGHPFTPENTVERRSGRTCRICLNDGARARYVPHPRCPLPKCRAGHEFTPDNTTVRRDGTRACKACAVARTRAWRLQRKTVVSQV